MNYNLPINSVIPINSTHLINYTLLFNSTLPTIRKVKKITRNYIKYISNVPIYHFVCMWGGRY